MGTLLGGIREHAYHMTTKSEIVGYFKETYPKGWQTKLVNGLFPHTNVKNAHNLERRFNPDRVNNVPRSKKEKQEYTELGKMLPVQLPEKGFHVTGSVFIKFSDGECEEREIDERITRDEAEAMLKMNTRDAAQSLVNKYMEEEDTDEPSASVGDCNPPDLTVVPL